MQMPVSKLIGDIHSGRYYSVSVNKLVYTESFD